MIPVRLQLHNFMSYGQNLEPLDFKGIDLACLSGSNGVGKSALLEAITWALWGKSRAKSDDDLVKAGTNHMFVDFEFELEGKRFRVIRKRSLKKKSQGSLDFMVRYAIPASTKDMRSQVFNDWQILSGTSKAETQQKIIETLKMDYDTFINSAFLRQGHADEFTVKKPAERKAILGEILGLSAYDQLEEKVKELKRNKDIEKESLKQLIEGIELQIKDKKIYQKEVEKIEKTLSRASEEIKHKEEKVSKLVSEKNLLELQRSQIDEISSKIRELEMEINDLKSEYAKHKKNYQKAQEIISQKEHIENNFRKLQKFKKENEKFVQTRLQKFSLISQKANLEKKIANRKKEIEIEQAKIVSKIKENEDKISQKEKIERELKKIKDSLRLISQKEKEKEQNLLQIQRNKEKKANFIALLSQIETLGKELNEKINALSKAKAQCPLCNQALSLKHREKVKNDLLAKKAKKVLEYKKTKEKILILDNQIKKLEDQIHSLEQKLVLQKKLERDLFNFEKSLDEIKRIEKEFHYLRRKNEDLAFEIKKGNFDLKNIKKLEVIVSELEKLDYDEEKHKKVERCIEDLSKYEELHNTLAHALEKEKEEKEYLTKNKELQLKKEKLLAKYRKKKEEVVFDSEKLRKIIKQLDNENKKLQRLRTKILGVQSEYGAAKEKIQRIKSQESELFEKKAKLKQASAESLIYKELSQAFSRKGIQAMIIESVIPEIEQEANNLLSQMTDGRMRINFLTQKEKKTDGGIIETLDIKITDETGTKNYEMYSGGEAFRINFAIRIALSKLLARRSGAKLQFLVIDEGFGTQDAAGREHLISAINSVREDFKKILIITHLQEIKDIFPTRIDVTKNEEGSKFEIVS